LASFACWALLINLMFNLIKIDLILIIVLYIMDWCSSSLKMNYKERNKEALRFKHKIVYYNICACCWIYFIEVSLFYLSYFHQ
jgi:hypothetical protein